VLRLHRNYAYNYGTRNYAFCYTQTLARPYCKLCSVRNHGGFWASAAAVAARRSAGPLGTAIQSLQHRSVEPGPLRSVDPSQQPAADRSLTAMHGLTSLDLGSREPYNATWGHPLRMRHTCRTPTHPSQSSPLSPGKASVTDMTTCNGYIHFFLKHPQMGPRGVVGRP
jgi:hypothetical protein